jgi:protein-S-isoprenylcysteine O-methyltransferase Ste14
MKLNLISLALLAIFAVIFFRHATGYQWTAMRITGIAIAAPALLLLMLARVQLGRAFSIQAKATTLVTSGLYSRIRNPIYVFGALFAAGLMIWSGKLWLLLFFAVLIPLQIFRSRKESEVLEARFGDEYRAYKRKTWF